MRIVHVISSLATGGAEAMLYKLAQGIDREAYQFAVVSLWGEGTFGPRLKELGIPVYCLNMDQGENKVNWAGKVREVIRKEDPEWVQGWMYHGNLAATLGAMGSGRERGLSWNMRHSLDRLSDEKVTTQLVIRAGIWLSHRADHIIYNSRTAMAQHEKLGFAAGRSCFIANGFDLERFKPDAVARKEVREELGIAEDAPVVSLIQRWHPMKDHATFLDAMVKSANKDLQIVLVGRDVNGENDALKAMVEERKLTNRTHLLGERSDVARLCNASDLLCTSSFRGEGFPNIVGEAMACGVPCVVTDVGDSAFVVAKTGRVVAPRDSEAMAAGVDSLLKELETSLELVQKRCRSRVTEAFELSHIVAEYEQLYGQRTPPS